MTSKSKTATAADVRLWRMQSLFFAETMPRDPLGISTWHGAMQSQDASSGHWSLGVRMPASTESQVVDAFEKHKVVRTWPMRGTIHTVPAQDAGWLLEHVGIRALAGAGRRREQLGLTLADVERAADVLGKATHRAGVMTRAEAQDALVAAGFPVEGQRSYHFLWFAAQIGVICIGPQRGSDQTFVNLADWVSKPKALGREDAIAELLFRFVQSHGPVSLKDFVGWTGLTLGDAKAAAEANAGRLVQLQSEVGAVWATVALAERMAAESAPKHPVLALPGFDEFMLGYKDRSLQLPGAGMSKVVPGNNGMFRATVVVDGQAVAVWTKTATTKAVKISVEPLSSLSRQVLKELDAAFAPYATFIGKPVQISVEGD